MLDELIHLSWVLYATCFNYAIKPSWPAVVLLCEFLYSLISEISLVFFLCVLCMKFHSFCQSLFFGPTWIDGGCACAVLGNYKAYTLSYPSWWDRLLCWRSSGVGPLPFLCVSLIYAMIPFFTSWKQTCSDIQMLVCTLSATRGALQPYQSVSGQYLV